MSWRKMPLGEVATLQRGFDLPIQSRHEGDVPIFAANGPVGFHNEMKVGGPGVVTGRSGSIGKVHFVGSGYWPLNTALYVKNFHGNDPKYVYWLLRNLHLERFHHGTGVPTLNRNVVHREAVSVPPLVEQRRIAAILDKADALRTMRREAIAKLDQLLQSVFLDMFGDPLTNQRGWPVDTLGNVAKFINGDRSANYPSRSDFVENGVPFFNAGHLRSDGKIDFAEMNYISNDKFNRLSSGKTMVGDVLYCLRGSLGKAAIVDYPGDAAVASSLVILRPGERVQENFLYHFLRTPFSVREMRNYDNGSAQPNLSAASLKKFRVFVPPLDDQRRFTTVVGRVRRDYEVAVEQLDKMDALFESLQLAAFARCLG